MDEPVLIAGADAAPDGRGDGLVSAAELAASLGVTVQSVCRWVRECGMPVAVSGGTSLKPRRRFDLARCTKWRDANFIPVGVTAGGVREGAGRPAGTGGTGKKRGRPLGSRNRRGVGLRVPGAGDRVENGLLDSIDGSENLDPEPETRDPVPDSPPAPLTPGQVHVQVKTEKARLDIEEKRLELDKAKGLLIDRDVVRKTWAAALKLLAGRLDSAPMEIATDVVGLVEELVRAVVENGAAGGSGTAETVGRVAEVVRAKLDACRREIVDAVERMEAA